MMGLCKKDDEGWDETTVEELVPPFGRGLCSSSPATVEVVCVVVVSVRVDIVSVTLTEMFLVED